MLLLLAACTLPIQTTSDRVDLADAVSGATIDLGTGSLEVVGDPDIVGAHVRWWSTFIGTEAPSLDAAVVDGQLVVSSECPEALLVCEFEVDIAVPEGVPVTFDGGTGGASFTAVGDVNADVGTGDVDLEDVGHAELYVGTGSVRGTGIGGGLVVDGGTGDVDVSLDAVGEISVDVGTGDVDLEVPGGAWALALDVGTGTVEVSGVQDDPSGTKLEVSTGTGDVTIAAR